MIRYATLIDAAAIADIHVDTWRAAYRGIVPDAVLASLSVASRENSWRRGIEADPRSVLVAEADGAMIGWIAVGSCRDDDAKLAGEIYAIYVRSKLWGGGVGRALMLKGEEEVWSRGFAKVVLWVLEQNDRARRFYESLGYTVDGGSKAIIMGEAALREIRYEKPKAALP